jgi:hypothetical protein
VRAFASAARLPEERVAGTLLTYYDGVALALKGVDLADPVAFRLAAVTEWAYFRGSHVCPECLRESGGIWRLAWKLPWSFACVRHRCLLVDTCPSCERRIGAGKLSGGCGLPFPSKVPVPTACNNPSSMPPAPAPRPSEPCGHPLDEVNPLLLGEEWPRLLEAQDRIDGALVGTRLTVAGQEVAPLAYFSDLRSLTATILAWGLPEDLGALPDVPSAAFERHVEEREALRAGRSVTVTSRGTTRTRRRPYAETPQSASLMAAVLPLAASMLAAPSSRDLADSLAPVAVRVREDDTVRFLTRVGNLRPSALLMDAWERCVRPYQRTVYRLRLGRKQGQTRPPLGALNPGHVPQLLWKEEYEASFARLLSPSMSENHARAFCSMALVKLVGSHTWKEAATELGLPEDRSKATANNALLGLNRRGAADLFGARLHELAQRLSSDSDLVDYGLRRRLFADYSEVEPEAWARMCREARVIRGKPGCRSGAASAWLWCLLTGGDLRLAPWYRQNSTQAGRAVYRNFVGQALGRLREPLTEYAERLLEGAIGEARNEPA